MNAYTSGSSLAHEPDRQAPIEAVAIGASAGGVSALIPLLQALPAGFLPPVFILLHLPPDRNSLFPELFARHCRLPFKEAEDKEPIRAGSVYMAPPNYHLLVEPERHFSLSMDEPEHYSRPAIDLLFESAAYAYQEGLLGILLTGASIDGSRGLGVVREMGGAAWVQDPEEAEARLMPASAIAQAGADRVLTIQEMADRLRASSQFTRAKDRSGDD